ncbi:MAG: hypothetical protein GY767_22690 [Shimia sp.]|nr:hypothetical protein [Shimia sp.]
MATASTTKHMLEAYQQRATHIPFFSGFFKTTQDSFHNAEEVEIDIERSGEDISIAVHDISTGHRMNSANLYTSKGFKPPVHKEAFPVSSFELIKRTAGENPFEDIGFRVRLARKFISGMLKIEAKIRRAMEFQAAQALQVGVVTLTDESGAEVFKVDYHPKATHFPTAGTAWGADGADPIGDLSALAEVIRADGLTDATTIIMGIDAFNAFIADAGVQAYFDNRRIDHGSLGRSVKRNGGTYQGAVDIGNYKFEVWTVPGRYKHPQTGVSTPYMDPSKVIMLDENARLDATFGGIPNIGQLLGASSSLSGKLPMLPSRFRAVDNQMDLNTNLWLSNDGEQLFGGVGSRPLMIPTAIDTFGCLETSA